VEAERLSWIFSSLSAMVLRSMSNIETEVFTSCRLLCSYGKKGERPSYSAASSALVRCPWVGQLGR
jgi:hypothetical protein